MRAPSTSRRPATAPLRRAKSVARRTNAERSALTRGKLLDAAVRCLYRHGYAATSTTVVAKAARVSRGAMLHQFPTKVDLMLAVAEHAMREHEKLHLARIPLHAEGLDQFLALTDVTWEAFTQPPAVALLEIMVASRSDKKLARRFPPFAARLDQHLRDRVWDLATKAGITNRTEVDAMVRLHLAAMRALSLEVMLGGERAGIDDAFALLRWYKRQLGARLRAEAGQADPVS